MIVGIIGSGGREHAICESLKTSNKINKIYIISTKIIAAEDIFCIFCVIDLSVCLTVAIRNYIKLGNTK